MNKLKINNINKLDMVQKVVFALVMGMITTGIISFALIFINVGMGDGFVQIWMKSWFFAYLLVIPAILFIAPPVEKFVNKIVNQYFT